MKQHHSRTIGKRAIAAMLSVSLLTTGVTTVAPTIAFAAEEAPTQSATGKTPIAPNKHKGGKISVTEETVTQGGLVTVQGTGFKKRPSENPLTFKINDGRDNKPAPATGQYGFPDDQTGATIDKVSGGWGELTSNLPGDDGTFTVTLRLPEDLPVGYHWIRVLGSDDEDTGADTVSAYAWMKVVEPGSDDNDAGETPRVSVTGDKPGGGGKITGDGTLTAGTVEQGGVLHIDGTGFAKRPDNDQMAVKINDGKIAIGEQGDRGLAIVKDGTGILRGDQLPGDDGSLSFNIVVPENLTPGDYWLRVLGGDKNGGAKVSNFVWFTVTEKTSETPATQPTVTAENGYKSSRSGSIRIPVKITGFPANTDLIPFVNDTEAKWSTGRHKSKTITTDENGTAEGTAYVSSKEGLNAGVPVVVKVQAKDENKTSAVSNEVIVNPSVKILSSTVDGLDDSAQNSTVKVQVVGLPKDASVTFVGVGETNFLTGDQKGVSNDDSLAEITDVKIPGNEDLLGKPITIKYTVDGNERTSETYYTVTPDNSLFGTDKYTVEKAELDPGLYQVRFNHNNGKLYVARTDRSSNKAGTRLMIVNPDTLKVEKEIEPKATGDNNAQVFGVGLDQKRDRVWTTNSTADSVAVYDADLNLIHQFPADVVSHGRDVVIDESTGLAYVGSPRSDAESLTVFNAETKTYEQLPTPGFSGAMTLRLDQETGDLYSVSQSAPKAVKVNVRTKAVTVYDLPEDKVGRASGLAIDPETGYLYIASQDTHNVVVFDPAKKAVVADIPTGDQALSVVYNPVTKRIYTTNRTAGTVTVIDPKTNEKVANLDAGIYPNDLEVDNKGRIFVTNKVSRTGANKDGFFRFTPVETAPAPTTTSSTPAPTTTSSTPAPTTTSSTPAPTTTSSTPAPTTTSSTPAPTTTSSTPAPRLPKLLTGFLVTFGVLGGLAALFGFLAKIGIIPVHVLPVQLRHLLHL
ncbi:YncE family protein [Corynebacterium sp. P5848]|uniref:YncE family protein n=1 Tax=Corynebacterium marambiense TaxID=2765364 RepID=UPI0022608ACA|nr:YncE family protein [Corynebacterium marambiense]MCX7543699.1 YncE family protein [Corynebacterium marambiense]